MWLHRAVRGKTSARDQGAHTRRNSSIPQEMNL